MELTALSGIRSAGNLMFVRPGEFGGTQHRDIETADLYKLPKGENELVGTRHGVLYFV